MRPQGITERWRIPGRVGICPSLTNYRGQIDLWYELKDGSKLRCARRGCSRVVRGRPYKEDGKWYCSQKCLFQT